MKTVIFIEETNLCLFCFCNIPVILWCTGCFSSLSSYPSFDLIFSRTFNWRYVWCNRSFIFFVTFISSFSFVTQFRFGNLQSIRTSPSGFAGLNPGRLGWASTLSSDDISSESSSSFPIRAFGSYKMTSWTGTINYNSILKVSLWVEFDDREIHLIQFQKCTCHLIRSALQMHENILSMCLDAQVVLYKSFENHAFRPIAVLLRSFLKCWALFRGIYNCKNATRMKTVHWIRMELVPNTWQQSREAGDDLSLIQNHAHYQF